MDDIANTRREAIIKQYRREKKITEDLKSLDQLEWVRQMNEIYQIAEEIVLHEIIYS